MYYLDEVICSSQEAGKSVLPSLPGALVVKPGRLPFWDPVYQPFPFPSGKRCLEDHGWRLAHVSTHNALFLLKHPFPLPKLLHCLGTAPYFLSPGLQEYDEPFKALVSGITNMYSPQNSWSQATLPLRSGDWGIRSAVQAACTISLFAFNSCFH